MIQKWKQNYKQRHTKPPADTQHNSSYKTKTTVNLLFPRTGYNLYNSEKNCTYVVRSACIYFKEVGQKLNLTQLSKIPIKCQKTDPHTTQRNTQNLFFSILLSPDPHNKHSNIHYQLLSIFPSARPSQQTQ